MRKIRLFEELIFKALPIFDRKSQDLQIQCNMSMDAKLFYKFFAVETAINLISNTLSLAEFRTFEKSKEVRKDSHYLFNVEPNPNQNSSRFWRKVYHNLVYENEALVVMHEQGLFVADSFDRETLVFKDCKYKDVVIDDYKLSDVFFEKDVFYFQLHSEKMLDLVDSLYSDYGQILEYSKDNYKRSNAKRGTLTIPTNYPQTPQADKNLKDLLQVKFKDFFHAENGAVLPLTNGMTYQDLSSQTYKNGSDSRDIKNLIDDVFDYVAIAFQIPPQMLKGSVADSDKTWNNYMTHCIKPLGELIEDEINRKFYKKRDYLDKTYLKIDTTNIKHNDLKEMSQSIDLLTRNGVNTINDNLKLLGREELGGEHGDVRFMSLNLAPLDSVVNGGEDVEQKEQN